MDRSGKREFLVATMLVSGSANNYAMLSRGTNVIPQQENSRLLNDVFPECLSSKANNHLAI